MAHIKIDKREFEELLGREVTEGELAEKASFMGTHWNHIEGHEWDVEVYPNRPDMLSVEGLARAYRGFFEVDTGREEYEAATGDLTVNVDESVEDVRPYIGAAVVRDLELTRKKINGLIQLQEKMHETMGRRRDKLAIGLHDLGAVKPPFTYKAVEPETVSFTPLEYDREMGLGEILEEHDKGKKYSWILEDEDLYPVIVDADEKVLSFPPIINNQLTEVTKGTTDIFIDVTGKDRDTVLKALNILATALVERGGDLETVEVDGKELPDLEPDEWELDPDYLRSISGLDVKDDEIVELLEKMKFGAREKKGSINVEVPSYRTDIMHAYDLIEDAVIGYGYRNIEPEMPEIDQAANESDTEDFTSILRDILQGCGGMETNTYVLSNKEKLFQRMETEEEEIAEMSNALTEDYTAVRNWLIPSLMKVLERNRQHAYPQAFYEIADVAELDDSNVGASNRRKAAYVKAGDSVDYTDVKQVLQVVERDLGIDLVVNKKEYGCFENGRSAQILYDGEQVGMIGEFSSKVAENWGLNTRLVGFELDVKRLRQSIK